MHLFHKWYTAVREEGSATLTTARGPQEFDVIKTIRKCSKCPEERAYLKFPSGTSLKADPEFVRYSLGEEIRSKVKISIHKGFATVTQCPDDTEVEIEDQDAGEREFFRGVSSAGSEKIGDNENENTIP